MAWKSRRRVATSIKQITLNQKRLRSESGKMINSSDQATIDDELDEYGSGVYLCRWPNGEFSVVTAESKREAILSLDEWAGAHPSQVSPIDGFMADFRLDDDGEIVLNRFGEAREETVWVRCYPALRAVLASDEVIDDSGSTKEGAEEIVRKAVEHQRIRLWDNQPHDEPKTELGKGLAKVMGTSAVVADHYVEEMPSNLLERDDDDKDGKPN
jgi:hypothetical protein